MHKDLYFMRMQPTATCAKHLVTTCYAFAQNKITLNSMFNYTFPRTIETFFFVTIWKLHFYAKS